jgi:hypothetical protein
MVKIVSRRGKQPAPLEEGVDLELELVEDDELLMDDDHQLNLPLDPDHEEDVGQFGEYEQFYKEDWVIQHRQQMHYYDPVCPRRVGAISENSMTGMAEVWNGHQWFVFEVSDLCKLLQPKLIDVTIGHITYQMVGK